MFVNINGVRLYYEKIGDGQPLILVHGNGENHKIFQEAITVLCHYFTIYALDLRGHGRSSSVKEYHYDDMAEDLRCFIGELGMDKPLFYGFSDGGIIGLLLAIKYPELLSGLIVSGANLYPQGIKWSSRWWIRLSYWTRKDEKTKMMLKEPHISIEELETIKLPVLVTAGNHDVIRKKHTQLIARHIRNSECMIIRGEKHGSYIVNTEKIARIIVGFCQSKDLIEGIKTVL